jgi:hypothetical protein
MAKVLDKLSAGNNLTKEDCALFVQQVRLKCCSVDTCAKC